MDAHSAKAVALKVFLITCIVIARLISVYAHEEETVAPAEHK